MARACQLAPAGSLPRDLAASRPGAGGEGGFALRLGHGDRLVQEGQHLAGRGAAGEGQVGLEAKQLGEPEPLTPLGGVGRARRTSRVAPSGSPARQRVSASTPRMRVVPMRVGLASISSMAAMPSATAAAGSVSDRAHASITAAAGERWPRRTWADAVVAR